MTEKRKKDVDISKVAKALYSLDNECLRIRDMQKTLYDQGEIEAARYLANIKTQYYKLLYYTYRFLYRTGWIEIKGFYIQRFVSSNGKKSASRLYLLKLNNYTYYTKLNLSKNKLHRKDKLGEIDYIFKSNKHNLFTRDKSIEILMDFTKCKYNETLHSYTTPKDLYYRLLRYYSKTSEIKSKYKNDPKS